MFNQFNVLKPFIPSFAIVFSISSFLLIFPAAARMQSRSAFGSDGQTTVIQAGDWVNGQLAYVVLGQTNFTAATSGLSATQFNTPLQAAVDQATGKAFVADTFNSRVLRFSSSAAMTNGSAAEAVLGQPDFVTNSGAATAAKMNFPQSVFVDSAGRLWVADGFNNRVLRFDNASAKASGASADAVLGQPNLTSGVFAISASGMNTPRSVYADAAGRLWVTDANNRRVLRFDSAAAKANGAAADGVLGQIDFTSTNQGTAQNSFSSPRGIFGDSAGRLWVIDSDNNRVLRFDNAATKVNGGNADGVLGQTDFVSASGAVSQNKFVFPYGVTTDSSGRVYVSDSGNNRILIFNNAATLANGANASNVLGQSTFTNGTANTGGETASTVSAPRLLFFDELSQTLLLGDSANNRILRYKPAGTTAAAIAVGGRVLTADGRGIRNVKVTITDMQGNVKTVLTTSFGYYRFNDTAPGGTYVFTAASKNYTFREPSQVRSLSQAADDINFVANSR